ncbi:MAG: helix-turn-helix transcriptional regulator [Elusimicrobia bacterium]|nr:helix-turn-helix transcriptional regulator [Elusimicrobiota bacterium]
MGKDIYAVVGARIKEERLRAGLTLEGLAERADISRSFLAYIESNGRKASLGTIQRLAAALRVAPADLLGDALRPQRDALYDAAQQFTQLVRDKSPDETAAVLNIVRAATKRARQKR